MEVLQPESRTQKESVNNPSQEYLNYLTASATTDSGEVVSPEAALKNMGLYAAVKTIVEPLSHMPIPVIDTTGGNRKIRRDHPVHRLLNVQFNDEHHAMEGREMLFGHYILRGDGFAQILRNRLGDPVQLWPLNPDAMSVERKNGKLLYHYMTRAGKEIPLEKGDVLHLRNMMGSDGLRGCGFIRQAANALGLSIATEKYASKLYKNGARPSGIVRHPKVLSKDAGTKLRSQLQDSMGGMENMAKIAILEEGMEWQKLGLTAEEAQIVESRKFQIAEVARGLLVQPHKVGIMDNATFSNIEHQSLEFVIATLMAHARRFEYTIMRDLLSREEQGYLQAHYNFNALVRGDMRTRYASYAIGRQWGWLSVDDIRELEDMEALPDGIGKIYLIPMNMGNAADPEAYKPKKAPEQVGAPAISAPDGQKDRKVITGDFRKDIRHSFLIVANDICQRWARKEAKAVESALKSASLKGTPADFRQKITAFYSDFEAEVQENLLPLARSFAAAVAPGNADYLAKAIETVQKRGKTLLDQSKNCVILQDFSQPDVAYRAISETLADWKQDRAETLAEEIISVFDADAKEAMALCA